MNKLELSVGVLCIIPALVITFIADHSLSIGLVVFGVWALVCGITASQLLRRATERSWRAAWQWTEVIGLAAIVLWALGYIAHTPWLMGGWAIGFAAFTLLRTKLRFLGIVTAVFGLAQLLMPVNPVVTVGVFGAYLVVVGVWLVIGALSPRSTVDDEGAEHV